MFGDITSDQSPSHKYEDDEQAKTVFEMPMQDAEIGNMCTHVPSEARGYFRTKVGLLKLKFFSKV